MEEVSITRAVELDAPAEDVWRALTDPQLLGNWLEGDVELDVRPGGEGTIVEADGAVRRAVVEHVDYLRRLSLRWWPSNGADGPASQVRLELEPTAVGTRLVVTETVLGAAPGAASPVASASAVDARWGVRFLLLGCCLLVRATAGCR